jgi:transketolase
MRELLRGFHELNVGDDACILSSGYMLQRTSAARWKLAERGLRVGVIDLFRIKPIISGGFGSAVLEAMAYNKMSKRVRLLGLPDRYYFENGGREHLLNVFGLSVDDICAAVRSLL